MGGVCLQHLLWGRGGGLTIRDDSLSSLIPTMVENADG